MQRAADAAATSVPQWRTMLQRSIGKNRSLAYSRYVQLATVREDGRPANRTVVYRCVALQRVCGSGARTARRPPGTTVHCGGGSMPMQETV